MAKTSVKSASLFSEAKLKSTLFYGAAYKAVEKKIISFLNAQSKESLGITASVRTAGDKIPEVLILGIKDILGTFASNYIFPTSRKKSANIIFDGEDGLKYHVDIITHNVETEFNMPNITSVDRLQELYVDNRNIFVVLLIDYKPSESKNNIVNVHFTPIEFLSWECLTIGALGAGQIQIRRASVITKIEKYSRKTWMNDFTEHMIEFYVNENYKLSERLLKANRTRVEWLKREDVWK
ncbi:MAG: hypothetical protein QHH13_10585 [Melioribacter sp.]|uniref:hypothetical protein n=1 Tax=Rosettibacter primus TaxID=3111523 RepID=UPI00247D039C|nr:hypothetical protein [Melioribacter sp.]